MAIRQFATMLNCPFKLNCLFLVPPLSKADSSIMTQRIYNMPEVTISSFKQVST